MKLLSSVVAWWLRNVPGWLAPAAVLTVGFWAVFLSRLDPDFGWHLRSGNYIWQHGIPTHDIYTYTAADFPWVNHEWLSDVLIAGVYAVGGFALVTGVFAALWAAAMTIAGRRPGWAVMGLGFLATVTIVTGRPNVWTGLGLALVLWLTSKHRLKWLIPIFFVWAQLHGGFVLGLVVIAILAVRHHEYRWVWLACVAVTFINPYGYHLYEEIWRTTGDARLYSNVVEWQPLRADILNGWYIVAFLAAGVFGRWKSASWFPAALLAASVASVRHFPLFMVASLGFVGERYSLALAALPQTKRLNLAIILVVIVVSVGSVVYLAKNPDVRAPEAQVAQLKTQPCAGRVFNDYDFGGYLIWQLPDEKVFIDGRMPSWKYRGRDYLGEWVNVMNDAGAAQREFVRYEIGCALLLPRHQRLMRQLKTEGWVVSSVDSQAVLLRRPVEH